ncbi:MAG: hypothetical protein ACYDH6_24600, partial [Acidimicrobiales bacterium]
PRRLTYHHQTTRPGAQPTDIFGDRRPTFSALRDSVGAGAPASLDRIMIDACLSGVAGAGAQMV